MFLDSNPGNSRSRFLSNITSSTTLAAIGSAHTYTKLRLNLWQLNPTILGAKVFAWLLILQLQIYTFTALMSPLYVVLFSAVTPETPQCKAEFLHSCAVAGF